MTTINIIIADDHVLFADGLKLLLKDEEDMNVMAVAANGKELLEKLVTKIPDVVLLDIHMPVLDGLKAARRIHETWPRIKIVMLCYYETRPLIEQAREAGASGYLRKDCTKAELTKAIRDVANGGLSFPEKRPARSLSIGDDKLVNQLNLTKRELEVIQLIKQGLTNQEIADKLVRSVYTVETHRKNIMQKLGINKPSELIKFILEHNL